MNVNEKLIKSISQRLSIDLPTTKPEESMNQIDKYEDTIDLQQKTINKLRRDLNAAKETIFRLRKNEDRLREKYFKINFFFCLSNSFIHHSASLLLLLLSINQFLSFILHSCYLD